MELWIRSQNRHSLTTIKSIYVSNDDNNCEDIMGLTSKGHIFLGRYKSKERALEVLDEIQKLMQPIFSYTPIVKEKHDEETMLLPYIKHEQVGSKTEVIELSTCVYEMPKE